MNTLTIPTEQDVIQHPELSFVTDVMLCKADLFNCINSENYRSYIAAIKVTALHIDPNSDNSVYSVIRRASTSLMESIGSKEIRVYLTDWRDLDMMQRLSSENWNDFRRVTVPSLKKA